MRNRWYGDNRDLVKWSVLLHLAEQRDIGTILQVTMYRPENRGLRLRYNRLRRDQFLEIPLQVLAHFPRDVQDVRRLGGSVGLNIEPLMEPFIGQPQERVQFGQRYFGRVSREIKGLNERVIVSLDPDTGIERRGIRGDDLYKYVTADELRIVFNGLKAGDILAFYQHGMPGAKKVDDWHLPRKRTFAKAIGFEEDQIGVWSCEALAADVVLFSVEKG